MFDYLLDVIADFKNLYIVPRFFIASKTLKDSEA